ncbi:MAG: hypothetical protein ABI175_18915 [Polyangiales bacterium]
MWRLLALSVVGCGGAATPPARQLSNEVPVTVGRMAVFELGRDSFGPITALTRATEESVRSTLGSRYRVEPVSRHGTEIHAFLGSELLFYVIPNSDGTLFNIHAVSPKISIVEHPDWVIGSPFQGADALTDCECWGEHPMCFQRGDHVAVGFVVDCDDLKTKQARKKLQGVPIQRAVWNPREFGGPADDPVQPGITSAPPRSLKEIFGGDP